MKRILNQGSVALINYLMSQPEISDKVLNDKKDKDKYKFYTIREDGNIIFGKAFFFNKGFSEFWCRLLNCQDIITFEAFALKVWDALVDLSKGANSTALQKGLSEEIATKAQREGEYNWVIKRLYDCYEHVCNNKSEASSAEDRRKSGSRVVEVERIHDPKSLVINVNGVQRKIINLTDCIGDPIMDLVYEPHIKFRGGI